MRQRSVVVLALSLAALAVQSCAVMRFEDGYLLIGLVTDSVTGLPVDSARVQVGVDNVDSVDSLWSEYADDQGRFEIYFFPDTGPSDFFILEFTKEGYVTKRARPTAAVELKKGLYWLGVRLSPETTPSE